MTPLDPAISEWKAFLAVFLSWFFSQLVKVIQGSVMKKRFNFRWLFDAGGMPSSHSATVASLSMVTGFYYGFHSLIFLIVLIFSIITMFDAAGVRRSVGRQAQTLNRMLEDFYEKGVVSENRVKELLGHTPVEVLVGALTGVSITYLIGKT